MKLNRRYSVPEKAGNRKYMAIYPSPPSKHSFSELSITCGHGRLPLLTSHILSSDPLWLPCICGQCSKQPFAYHWVHTLTPLSWPDYPCPGGPSTTDGSSSRGFGVVGVKWYGFLYSQACLRSLSLSLESRRQAKRKRELMWRCNDIISYWDDKYRHTGRVTIPFKLLIHRSHIGNSFLYHCIACRILIFWGDHIAKQFETFDGDFGFRTWNGNFVGPNDVPGWQLDNTYLQKKFSWIKIAPQ